MYLADVFEGDPPEPVKTRKMRDEERQSGLFEEGNEGEGEEVDAESDNENEAEETEEATE